MLNTALLGTGSLLAGTVLDQLGVPLWATLALLVCVWGWVAIRLFEPLRLVLGPLNPKLWGRPQRVTPPKPDLTFEIDHKESSILVWPRSERHELQIQLRGRFLNALEHKTVILNFGIFLIETSVIGLISPQAPLGAVLEHKVLSEPDMAPINLEAGIALEARSASGFYWLVSKIALPNELVGKLSDRHVVTLSLHTLDGKMFVLIQVPVDWKDATLRPLRPMKDALLTRMARRQGSKWRV